MKNPQSTLPLYLQLALSLSTNDTTPHSTLLQRMIHNDAERLQPRRRALRSVPGHLIKLGNHSPVSITLTLVSPTTSKFSKLDCDEGGVVSDSSRLTDHYAAAYKYFFVLPRGAPCIFNSGPAWLEPTGPQAQRFIRGTRPVYGHPIADSWLKIGTGIYKYLDSRSVKWTLTVGFANAVEKTPVCQLLMWIGVKRETLDFEDAVTAANGIKDILSQAGFPDIEVTFRELRVTRSVAPKLLPFNPLIDPVPDFRKHFTPTLSLSIAPYKTPYYEGSSALYFRLSKDDDRVALLTAAHVARPPPVYAYTGMSRKKASQPRKEIVALGSMGYQNATNGMMAAIGDLGRFVTIWKDAIARLGELEFVEARLRRSPREENQSEVDKEPILSMT